MTQNFSKVMGFPGYSDNNVRHKITDSGMTPRVPRVAQSSLKIFPSIDRFWSKGATENACMICAKINETKVCTKQNTETYPV